MKDNKIIVVVADTPEDRAKMIATVAIARGFARTAGDAMKIVRAFTQDFDINTSYFILAATHNFDYSPISFEMLYRQAALGLCVAIGVKKLPSRYLGFCNVLYKSDFARL